MNWLYGRTDASKARIRVLVVEPHAAVRHAIVDLVNAQEDMDLVGQATTYEDALVLCACTQPDVVLMAITMQGTSAAATTRTICSTWPPIRVLCISGFQDEGNVPGVMEAGAAGTLLKNITAEKLAASIRQTFAANNQPHYDPHLDAHETVSRKSTH